MADIFLSYTEKDRDVVRHLAERLQSAGWSVWWDRRIPAGQTWRSVLERELKHMRCMVVLWSQHSVASDWVCEEAAEGRLLGRLVPVLIEPVRPPAGFREIQAADLVGWDGSPDAIGLRRLVEDIERLIGRPGTVAPAPVADDAAVAVEPQSFPWGMSALLVAIAVAAYFGTLARKPVEPKIDAVRAPAPAQAAPAASLTQRPAPPASTANIAAASAASQPGSESSWSTASRCAALRERLAQGQSMSSKSQAYFRVECNP